MTDAVPMLRLVLHDVTSMQLVRQALENYQLVNTVLAGDCGRKAIDAVKTQPLATVEALQRRAKVYAERRDNLQLLIDQLPTKMAPLLAPLGEK